MVTFLLWVDSGRGHALGQIAKKFRECFGLKVTIETPEKIKDIFQLLRMPPRVLKTTVVSPHEMKDGNQ